MTIRIWMTVLVVIAISGAAYAAFENRAAQQAFERYDQAMSRAEREYTEATEKAVREYRQSLERALRLAEQRNRHDESQEIEEALESVQGTRLERRIRDTIVGVWHDQSGTVEFAPDGRVIRSYVAGVGQWRVHRDGLVEVVFEAGTTPRWLVAVPGGSGRAVCIRFRKDGEVGAGALHTRE